MVTQMYLTWKTKTNRVWRSTTSQGLRTMNYKKREEHNGEVPW